MRRWLPILLVLLCFPSGAALARIGLKPAPQLWVYAAKMDLESAKKLVAQTPFDPATLSRALYNAVRRYKPADAEAQAAIARLLLQNGADPNYAALNGQTTLMAASAVLAEPVVKLLLENGAKADAKDPQGRDALSYAQTASGNDTNAVAILLKSPPPPKPLYGGPRKPKPELSNVEMAEQGKLIVFSYDLEAPEPVCVKLIGSLDGGGVYDMKFEFTTGDVGKGVKPGKKKRIVWDVDKDYPKGLGSDNVVVDVTAEYCD